MFFNDELIKSILENISDGVYYVDVNRKIFFWNKQAEKISGFSKEEVVGTHCTDNILRHVDEKGTELCKTECPLVYAFAHNTFVQKEVFLYNKKGHRVPVLVKVIPVVDSSNQAIGAVEIFNEITDTTTLKKKLNELKNLAFIDELTGVANRRGINFLIKEKIQEINRYKRMFAIFFIDLDNFKHINDTYSHQIGDKVLKMVAETLKMNLRTNDIVGRFGGDEFVVVSEIKDENSINEISQKIVMLINDSFFEEKGKTIRGSASIGAVFLREDDTVNKALKRADKFMYISKNKGKNNFTVETNNRI